MLPAAYAGDIYVDPGEALQYVPDAPVLPAPDAGKADPVIVAVAVSTPQS